MCCIPRVSSLPSHRSIDSNFCHVTVDKTRLTAPGRFLFNPPTLGSVGSDVAKYLALAINL